MIRNACSLRIRVNLWATRNDLKMLQMPRIYIYICTITITFIVHRLCDFNKAQTLF